MKRLLDPEAFGPWASSGIGKEFARQLAANGLHVVLAARRLPLLEDLGHQLASSYGVRYRAVKVDLTEPGFLAALNAATQDLDIGLVISNAGAFIPGAFLELDRAQLKKMIHLNVIAHVEVAHNFGQRLASRGRGGLLLVASTAGLQGIPFSAEYAAAKGFVLNLGEAIHVELQTAGVHVTTLLPGAVDTPMLTEFGFDLIDTPIKPMSPERCVAEGLAALRMNRATQSPCAGTALWRDWSRDGWRPGCTGSCLPTSWQSEMRPRAYRPSTRAPGVLRVRMGKQPYLLESIMRVDVVMPEAYLGDVMGDLASQRGHLLGMEDRSSSQNVQANVPPAEMFGCATKLRSMTSGRATDSMEFSHYAEMPGNLAEAVGKRTTSRS